MTDDQGVLWGLTGARRFPASLSAMPNTTISLAGAEEASAIAKIRVLAWQRAYRGLVPQGVLDAMNIETDTQRTRQRMLEPRRKVAEDWLLRRGGAAIGWLSTGTCRDKDLSSGSIGEVFALYVLPEAWGQGIGHALMNFAANRFSKLRYKTAVVWVMEGNEVAERFYERQGYALDGTSRPLNIKDIPGKLRRFSLAL